MSVIVKGMEMPTCCECCEVESFEQNSDGYIIDSWCPAISDVQSTIKIRRESRHPLCPLAPLPEKHGRLIDADAMKRVWMGARIDGDIGVLLDARPTVVEAEGEE